jgi:hypothetical protein
MKHATSLSRMLRGCAALAGFSLIAVAAASARADYGAAVFVVGRASVTEHSGETRALVKGTQIRSGDLVRTFTGARVQLRFADGAFVSMLPDSELSIDAYRFGGAAEGRETAFFTLRRGGARFLTGAIGKARGSRFRTTTAPASIEVETGEFVAIVAKGLQLSVGVGRVDLRNERGVLGVVAGQRAFVADRATAPYLVGTAIPYRIAP